MRLAPLLLEVAAHWMVRQRAAWERRFDQLDNVRNDLKEQQR